MGIGINISILDKVPDYSKMIIFDGKSKIILGRDIDCKDQYNDRKSNMTFITLLPLYNNRLEVKQERMISLAEKSNERLQKINKTLDEAIGHYDKMIEEVENKMSPQAKILDKLAKTFLSKERRNEK